MKTSLALFIITFISFACQSTNKEIIYQTQLQNKEFTVKQCIRKTSVSNYLYYEITNEKLKPIEINSLDDEHGLPYKEGIYGKAPTIFFDTTVQYCTINDPKKVFETNSAYLDEDTMMSENEKIAIKKYIKENIYENLMIEKNRFVLYLNPKDYTLQEFEDISKAFAANHQKLNKLLFDCQPFAGYRKAYDGWQLCGIVYGELDDFCEIYTKSETDFFKIFPDGRIMHYDELFLPGKNWISGQDFLYPEIEMPGNKIRLKSYTEEDLVNYRNEKGESIVDNFNIVNTKN